MTSSTKSRESTVDATAPPRRSAASRQLLATVLQRHGAAIVLVLMVAVAWL